MNLSDGMDSKTGVMHFVEAYWTKELAGRSRKEQEQ